MLAMSDCCQLGCQLCLKQHEIAQLRHTHKRNLSIQTIYKKDYHRNTEDQQMLALLRRTKNQRSHIHCKQKSNIVLESNYGINYHPNNPEKPIIAHSKDNIATHTRDGLQTYKSTYQSNYHQHPSYHVQENYKIADPQFYNLKTTFPQVTEYKRNYKLAPKTGFKQPTEHIQKEKKSTRIRLFETTQRVSYGSSKKIDCNLPVVPQNNMTTLPTTASLLTTTYRNEFIVRSQDRKEEKGRNNWSHFYNF